MTSPAIAIMATGGTIECLGADRLDTAWYPDTNLTLDPGRLLSELPELRRFCRPELVDCRMTGRGPVTADWFRLHRQILDLLDRGVDGIVVTHGTNPLEELAYFLHLTTRTTTPIVVTGAMRPWSALSGDGPSNLVNAVRVAVDPQARELGVVVVMNETILSARDVSKTSTHRLQAFQAPAGGPLGHADADRIEVVNRPRRRHTSRSEFEIGDLQDLPRVDITVSYVGADGVMIDAAVAAGARGIVNAGSGAGRPTSDENDALDRAVQAGVVVCQASRTGSGRVTPSPWLRRRRLIAGGDLQPWKARVLLSLALTRSSELDDIQRMFDEY